MIKKVEELVTYKRFDVMFKYLYIKHREMGINSGYFEELYKHHLKIWNNFKEHNNTNKQTYENFKEHFHIISDSIKDGGFDQNKSTVPVIGNNILNGAHRVASCLLHNKDVICNEGVDGVDGQKDCSYYYLKTLNKNGVLSDDYCDRCAMEYVKFKKNTFLITLFPSATIRGNIEKVRGLIKNSGNLVYEKEINLNRQGSLNLMKELYYKEKWAEDNNRLGYTTKRNLCYPSNEHPTFIFLVEFNSNNIAIKVKDEIRNIYNIGKHSVHINDHHHETLRLTKCLFNNNSINFMNNYNGKEYPLYENLLLKFRDWISENNLDSDNYCITAGSVLSTYGLKECKDIDYLHYGDNTYPNDDLIQSHNVYGVGKYHIERDEIIFNPEYHFYHFGVKFSTIDIVRKLKEKRGEEKDFRDIELIKNL